MKITNIRDYKGNKLSQAELHELYYQLGFQLEMQGWHAEISMVNASRIDITGPHHGVGPQRQTHNYRVNSFTLSNTRAGYKRCKTPTWKQREQLNHLVNNVLDKLQYSATVRSREFVIRCKDTGRVNSWDKPSYMQTEYTDGIRHFEYLCTSIAEAEQVLQAVRQGKRPNALRLIKTT